MAFVGHETCEISNGEHISNPHYGLTYSSLGLIMITNNNRDYADVTKTVVHEFGHLYSAPDHYGKSEPSTTEITTQTGDSRFNENCIYGELKEDNFIASNKIICEGCKARIIENLSKYSH